MSSDLRRQVPKDYRAIIDVALDAGWTLSRSRLGHVKLTAPDGRYAQPVPGNANSSSLRKRFASRLTRHGLDLPRGMA